MLDGLTVTDFGEGRSTSTIPTGLAPVEWGFEDYYATLQQPFLSHCHNRRKRREAIVAATVLVSKPARHRGKPGGVRNASPKCVTVSKFDWTA